MYLPGETNGGMFPYRIMWHKAFSNISFVGCINMVDHCYVEFVTCV